jgi:hypothetical protein
MSGCEEEKRGVGGRGSWSCGRRLNDAAGRCGWGRLRGGI